MTTRPNPKPAARAMARSGGDGTTGLVGAGESAHPTSLPTDLGEPKGASTSGGTPKDVTPTPTGSVRIGSPRKGWQ
jgi:hypothetical protein